MTFTDTQLYQLFSSLSTAELKELDKAVHSPFFNYRDEEIRLFQYLLKANKTHKAVTAEEAFKNVFPKQRFNMAKLRHVMTYVTRIITRYITIREMEQAEEQKRLLLTSALRKRNLGKLFLASHTDTSQYYNSHAQLSPGLYYNQLQLNTEYYTYSITNRKAKNEDLQRLDDDLDSFYIIQKLKHASNILSYKNLFRFDTDGAQMKETMALAQKKNLLSNPLVSLLYQNYLCLSEPDNEDYFVKLKELLLHNSSRINSDELRDIFTLAINYCIKRLNTGGQKYYNELFDIYEAGLHRLVFEENGKFSPFTYKNICAIAIGLKKYKWVAAFLNDYKQKLDSDIREGFYAYCMARYYFSLGKYEQVRNYLQEVEIKELFTDLDARVLLIKTYYELDEFNLLDYSIGNLKQQLKRKKLQGYHQTVYGNFAKTISRLTHLRPYDKKGKAVFKEKLAATNVIAEKEWLMEKVR